MLSCFHLLHWLLLMCIYLIHLIILISLAYHYLLQHGSIEGGTIQRPINLWTLRRIAIRIWAYIDLTLEHLFSFWTFIFFMDFLRRPEPQALRGIEDLQISGPTWTSALKLGLSFTKHKMGSSVLTTPNTRFRWKRKKEGNGEDCPPLQPKVFQPSRLNTLSHLTTFTSQFHDLHRTNIHI